MKIHILFPITDEPFGGGNQFLRALRAQFRELQVYAEQPADADVILFNSFPFDDSVRVYREVMRLKHSDGKRRVVVHRVDGPIAIVRGATADTWVDRSIVAFNQNISDATVFQSEWSREVCESIGVGAGHPCTTIPNAAEEANFFAAARPAPSDRTRIVAVSWSANWRKGFGVYRFLDRQLDHHKYDMTFVGNSPVTFQSIRHIAPLNSKALGDFLRTQDMYVTGTVDDVCSNSMLEAMACGLPAVARRSGGNPELLGAGGVLFDGVDDVLEAIDACASNIDRYRAGIDRPDMAAIAQRYLEFSKRVWTSTLNTDQRESSISPLVQARLLGAAVLGPRVVREARRFSRLLGVRERRWQRGVSIMRTAPWEPSASHAWSEAEAHSWIAGVLRRLPVFLDGLRHKTNTQLYRFTPTSDLNPVPMLASSIAAASLRCLTEDIDRDDSAGLAAHILSFAQPDGAIAQSWSSPPTLLERVQRRGRSVTETLSDRDDVWELTRQAFAALECLRQTPRGPFQQVPQTAADAYAYADALDWSNAVVASKRISNLAFFLAFHERWFRHDGNAGGISPALLAHVERRYRQADGAWYPRGAFISVDDKITAAESMVSALQAAGVRHLSNPESLIDLCLSSHGGTATVQIASVSVLHHCQQFTSHRAQDVRAYCLMCVRELHAYYWPWQGGFSLHADGANDRLGGARITTGAAEPDILGTAFFVGGIARIVQMLGWDSAFGLKHSLSFTGAHVPPTSAQMAGHTNRPLGAAT